MYANDKEIDFIVVGTGPGGATVAKELSHRNKKVLILEWGDNKPLVGSFWQGAKGMLIPGRSLLFTNQMLGLIRGITTGGSTIYYYATGWPAPLEMLKSHGVDITGEVEETRIELPIAPLKDEMMGPMATRIMESAQDLGYNWQKLDKLMFQDRWKPEYPFGYYGDPFGVKWSARMYVEEALKNGANLITGARATRVIIENRKAVGVEYKKNRMLQKAFAPKTIISGGGIGTPVILRASGIKNAGAKGIFKTGYFAAHPGGTVKIGDLLDSNLKTEYDNLYVCDCSVIPEAYGLPPTYTIIGLGKRLAKHLSHSNL